MSSNIIAITAWVPTGRDFARPDSHLDEEVTRRVRSADDGVHGIETGRRPFVTLASSRRDREDHSARVRSMGVEWEDDHHGDGSV